MRAITDKALLGGISRGEMPALDDGQQLVAQFSRAGRDHQAYSVVRNTEELQRIQNLGMPIEFYQRAAVVEDASNPAYIHIGNEFFPALPAASHAPAPTAAVPVGAVDDTLRAPLVASAADVEAGTAMSETMKRDIVRLRVLHYMKGRGMKTSAAEQRQMHKAYIIPRILMSLAYLLTEGHAKNWSFLASASRLNPMLVASKALWLGAVLPLTLTNVYNIYGYVACSSEPRSQWDAVHVQRQFYKEYGFYYSARGNRLYEHNEQGLAEYPQGARLPWYLKLAYSSVTLWTLAIANHITEMADGVSLGLGTQFDPKTDGVGKFVAIAAICATAAFFLKATPNTRIVNTASHENRSYETFAKHGQLVAPLADKCALVGYKRQGIAEMAAMYIPVFYMGLHAYSTYKSPMLNQLSKAAVIGLSVLFVGLQVLGTFARANAYEVRQVAEPAGVKQPSHIDKTLKEQGRHGLAKVARTAQMTPVFQKIARHTSSTGFAALIVPSHYLSMCFLANLATSVANNEVVCNLINIHNDPQKVLDNVGLEDPCGLTPSRWTEPAWSGAASWFTLDKAVLLGVSLLAAGAIAKAGVKYVKRYHAELQQRDQEERSATLALAS